MNCKNHSEVEANYYCSYCGQPLCLECSVELNKKLYCKECLEKSVEMNKINFSTENRFKKSKFLTFILSVIPGASHMYIGLINKGLSIMILFFGLIFFGEIIEDLLHFHIFDNEPFIIAIIVIFISYSLFDSLAKVNELNAGIIINDSNGVAVSKVFDFVRANVLGRKNFIGYAFVVLGSLSIFNMFSRAFDEFIQRFLQISMPFTMTDLLISLILVGAGVFFIKKGKDISA